METKVCKKCGKELPTEMFNKHLDTESGLQSVCRECLKKQYDRFRENVKQRHEAQKKAHEKSLAEHKIKAKEENKRKRELLKIQQAKEKEIVNSQFYVNPKNILPKELQYKPKQYTGELLIEKYLIGHSIQYLKEYTFDDCRDINPLRFDFYLPQCNTCIEYDGEQHFKPVNFHNDTDKDEIFLKNLRHDDIKNNYCKQHKIRLKRITYENLGNIEPILNKLIA